MSRNAVIMAAGMATRFVPLSVEIPKALLKVKGEILIERQIRQLREAGVEEIIVVTGYQKEQFHYLAEKEDVILIKNSAYQSRNNHSTLYAAREYLKDTFICSGDNYFTENVFLQESTCSYYASEYESGTTSEWCLSTDDSGRITQVQIGGCRSWVMKGHAYLTRRFSDRLIPYLKEAYKDEGSADKFWEEIYIEHIDELDLYIRKYEPGIIKEFDSLEELRAFDPAYISHSGSMILEKICQMLECTEQEIRQIQPVKEHNRAAGFVFECGNRRYRYQFRDESLQELT